ncbi:hypothetical protein B0H14DRAFT_3464006 [Mycena olivaceomarginata]|nr:hypothetical protein B0H14DRAFT_3464006 [Mycena olivaceomarginata]
MVENIDCEVNVLLCARVAFMGKYFPKDSSTGYWNTVVKALAKIRRKANGASVQISRAFKHILKMDRQTHGVDDYVIEDAVDDLIYDSAATGGGASGK